MASGQNDNTLYTISLINQEITMQTHDTLPRLISSAVPKEQDKIIFISGDDKIAEFDKKTLDLAAKDIAFPLPVKIKTLAIFNRRIYTLDQETNQIYKHNQTLNGYDKGVPWITDQGVDIKNAMSLAIDGDLFILGGNGIVTKLSAGKQVLFETSGILPPLKNPTEIWTYADTQNIYLLEPAGKRIVVINKVGKFIKQYVSEQWTNPVSMSVDEKSKTIYILDNNKIWKFGM